MRSCTFLAVFIVLVTAVCACDSKPSRPSMYQSGTRLRARVVDLEEAELFVEWWDTKEKVPCRFMVAEDGELRCLPIYPGYAVNKDCLIGPQGAPLMTAVSRFVPTPVKETAESARARCLGEGVFTAYERSQEPSNCGGTNVAMRRVAPERFVRARRTEEPLSDRFALEVIEAEDGARHPVAVVDRKAGASCDFAAFHARAPSDEASTGREARCSLRSSRLQDIYSDLECQQPVPGARPECAAFFKTIESFDPETRAWMLHEAVPTMSEQPLYHYVSEYQDRWCEAFSPGDAAKIVRFETGAEIEPPLLREVAIGSPVAVPAVYENDVLLALGTLEEATRAYWHTLILTDPDGNTFPLPPLYRGSYEGKDCNFVRRGDDRYVCTTKPLVREEEAPHFEDAECTKPLVTSPEVDVKKHPEVVWLPSTGQAEYVQLGEQVFPEVAYTLDASGTCVRDAVYGGAYRVEYLDWREPALEIVQR